ncbi:MULTISPECIES: septum formation initiator family protein [unclassified Microbacterium]|uniref:septum formation initiator family protein n=1 Tax=unclassified Microbacterium TaxID=2609290 RepID=UPI00214CD9DB|nr:MULTISPECIES: septum formation initiator family protein [unclassified Microbacterium]MCR2784340.1 septum formation initiator family protein [Microbacterium sp. zg.B96]MDL5350752.1 septum formation initiator family protein [Microbacterium sp. zg-YB36]WIM14834.1 septum formation initiator family protein [Microbacterium sp. zg-B96]
MAKTTAPPSRTQSVDVRAWLGGIRLSGFMVIMLGLVVLGALVLVPTVGTYLDQRQQIAALERSVQLGEDEVAELEAARDRWEDPAYITTQARERLYYHHVGEVVFLVDNDLPAVEVPREQARVSADVEETQSDWMTRLVRSVAAAGVAQTVTYEIGVPDAPTEAPTP